MASRYHLVRKVVHLPSRSLLPSVCLQCNKRQSFYQQSWIHSGSELNLTSHSQCCALSISAAKGAAESEGETTESQKHRDAEKEPLPEWPGGINPHTGEKGGPKGPEPTRFGDWERKGRVSDF